MPGKARLLQACPFCKGNGVLGSANLTCGHCDGVGTLPIRELNFDLQDILENAQDKLGDVLDKLDDILEKLNE